MRKHGQTSIHLINRRQHRHKLHGLLLRNLLARILFLLFIVKERRYLSTRTHFVMASLIVVPLGYRNENRTNHSTNRGHLSLCF